MLLQRPIRLSRPHATHLPKTWGRRRFSSSPSTFGSESQRDGFERFAEEKKRRFKESRESNESRNEVVFATRRPLEPLNRPEEDHIKAAERRVEEMLAQAKLSSPATRGNSDWFKSRVALRQELSSDELGSGLHGAPKSWTQHQNATSPDSASPQTLEMLELVMNGHGRLPEGAELRRIERSNLDRERTEKAIEWLKEMLRRAGKLNEASDQLPKASDALLREAPKLFEPPQRIEPLVYSQEEEAWIKSENAMSPDFNRQKLAFGVVLPVVQWNLRMFGPSQYIPARSTAAMDLLGEMFGPEPTSMAVTLHEVDPQTLQSIMSHPWVQRNFRVGFDDKFVEFDDSFVEHQYSVLPSVLLVSANMCTDNWIARRLGGEHRALSVDLPIQGEHERQDQRDLLRLCAARLDRVVLGKRWTAERQHRENKRMIGMENDVNDFMTTGHNPKDNVVSTVMARDLTFHHLDSTRGRQYRNKYRWWNRGAMRVREARVVDFWSTGSSTGYINNLEIDSVTWGGQFQYGINCKKNLGHISEAGPTMDASPARLLSDYGLQFKVRSWREVVDNHMLGWPRNVARVQRSKYWPYGPGSRYSVPKQPEQAPSDLPEPQSEDLSSPTLSCKEATETMEKGVPNTNTEPKADASASTPPTISYKEATEMMAKGLPITRAEPKADASASTPPSISYEEVIEKMEKGLPITSTEPNVSTEPKADVSAFTPPSFNVYTCNPGFNYDLTHGNDVLMWASDDYGIARSIKVIEKKPGWFGGKRRKANEPPPQEDAVAEVKTDSAGSTTEDPQKDWGVPT